MVAWTSWTWALSVTASKPNSSVSPWLTPPLTPAPGGWPGYWYELSALPDTIGMLIIDGPPWTVHPYVRGAAEILFSRIEPGGVILLDDAARPGERVVARRWKRNWPNFRFQLARNGTKGTLVGRRLC